MEKLDCKRLATAAFSFSIWIVKFKAFIQPFFNKIHFGAIINTAFDTLKSPLLRATYLLELQGINAFDEKDTQMDVDFLMNQIELRESLEAIKIYCKINF
jgi:DnaJ-domain-containing protein 1